jgi:hypothetical protein
MKRGSSPSVYDHLLLALVVLALAGTVASFGNEGWSTTTAGAPAGLGEGVIGHR